MAQWLFDELCLNGDCKTAWPTGGAGGGTGTVSTSTAPVAGQLAYWTTSGVNPELLSTVATGTLTTTATGIEFSATRGLVGGASVLSLTSGYVIPTTTRMSILDGYGSRANHTGTQLAATISDFVSTVRTSISETITGLTYTSGTGVLSIDSGYEIPTTTRMATWDAKGSGTVTSVAMTVPTGLSISGSPITTSGTLGLTYTAGYEGLLTASSTNWNGFYNVPSTRISDGTGLTWSSNTLNCDTASGSIQGCLTSTDWNIFNNKLASTSIDTSAELATILTNETGTAGSVVFSVSPIFTGVLTANVVSATGLRATASSTLGYASSTALTVSGNAWLTYASTTGISGTNLNFTNATSTTSFFSALGTFTNMVVNALATIYNMVLTGFLDVGDGKFELPNGTNSSIATSTGSTFFDTSDNQLVIATTTNPSVWGIIRTKDEIYKYSIPSTSPLFATGTTKYLPRLSDGYKVDEIWCGVEGGTSKVVNILGTNVTCTTGAGATASPNVGTVGAGSTTVAMTASTTVGVVNWVNVTITGRYIGE